MASNDEGRHKKTLKRRAATAIDVDLKLKNLRKVIESDDMNDAVEVDEETSPQHLGISVVQPNELSTHSATSQLMKVVVKLLHRNCSNDECEGWWDNGDADDSDAESLNSDVTDDDDRVSVDDVRKVGILFKHFVVDFEKLYRKLFNGNQHVIEQMAGNYLLKSAVRDEVLHLTKSHNVPAAVHSLFTELLHFPRSRELSKGIITNNSKIKLMGKADDRRKITIEEEVAVRNFLNSNVEFRSFIKDEDDFEE
ncbi:hypothetical protein DAPPUDRAFT_118934 [Daphnia pulex]|uniref:Uncharacterized protein n=1 Tax=Daphnia pulex TaxID=6669 RepID=E9HX20_DAPPU|nr:hypothetical protein DAPPUDRAFT_118934 [Daphnia pulex]|eukprot:EFX63712.1 hypothetical protein DAPPUDRAFT_118934 [Daphnia pulex]